MSNVRVNTAKVHIVRPAGPWDDLYPEPQGQTYCGRYESLQEFTSTDDEPTCQSCIKLAYRTAAHIEAEV